VTTTSGVRIVDLGDRWRLAGPVGWSPPVDPVPGVCSMWDRPGPVDLTRLAGLDLEGCALVIRVPSAEAFVLTGTTVDALVRAHMSLVATDTTVTNGAVLHEHGIATINGLDHLDLVPRAGFCLAFDGDRLTAEIRKTPWIL
jgi:hypothetical protein